MPDKPALTLVAIDDDPKSLELIGDVLAKEDLEILTSPDPAAGLEIVLRRRPEVVLLDLMMPRLGGMEVLERILEAAPETEVILITGQYSTESAVEAIRKGAADYFTKPLSVALLRQRIGRLVEETRRRQRALQLDGELLKTCQFEGMVGRSPQMVEVFRRIRRSAPHFRTALVTGATGTGKELVARALHRLSPASGGRFVVCNASAIVETLFESELFGHVRGAFTGAVQDKAGLLEYAGGGAVFLDEIGDMPLTTQAKLLRVLESREYLRVGSPVVRKTDARIIAATNRDLREMTSQNKFREDLYYRLSMVEIKLPRLAERREDLPLLERYFIDRFSTEFGKRIQGLTPRVQAVLARYFWPGNIRELQNVLGHACMMTEHEVIEVHDLPEQLRCPAAPEGADSEELLPMAEVHRRHALRVLASVNGNKVQASRILGIHRATLHRMLGESEPEDGTAGS